MLINANIDQSVSINMNLVVLKAEADVDQFMLEGHKFPRFAKVLKLS